jgi:hypothetical protein
MKAVNNPKVVYLVAAGEILAGVVLGAYLLIGLALSEKDVPVWALALVAAVYWWAFWELVRHARELVRWAKGNEDE